eukprot:2840398-Rhodomonas_salina.3
MYSPESPLNSQRPEEEHTKLRHCCVSCREARACHHHGEYKLQWEHLLISGAHGMQIPCFVGRCLLRKITLDTSRKAYANPQDDLRESSRGTAEPRSYPRTPVANYEGAAGLISLALFPNVFSTCT